MPTACYNNLPLVFLLILFGGSYFIYVYHFCLVSVKSLHNRIILIVLINIFAIMFLWSLFATTLSSVGRVPAEYKFTNDEHKALTRVRTDDEKDDILEKFCQDKNLLLQTCTPTGSIRYCLTCKHIKPDRAHHCATCETCFLKMDHHCPWINNCIGFRNYKSFILLVFYTCLYCFFYFTTTLEHVVRTIHKTFIVDDVPICVGFGFAVILGLVTFGFLCYHLYLTSRNETTFEDVNRPHFIEDDLTFDLGTVQNIMEVFGNKWHRWFWPVFSSMGCGHMFLVERK